MCKSQGQLSTYVVNLMIHNYLNLLKTRQLESLVKSE